MSQFYGADEDLTSSKKDAENITQDEEFATDIDLAIENVEFDQLNLKENIDNPSNLHGQKISSTDEPSYHNLGAPIFSLKQSSLKSKIWM